MRSFGRLTVPACIFILVIHPGCKLFTPKPPPPTDQFGCILPPKRTVTIPGKPADYDAKILRKLITNDLDYDRSPEPVVHAGELAENPEVATYVTCLDRHIQNIDPAWRLYLTNLSAFLETGPTGKQFVQWQRNYGRYTANAKPLPAGEPARPKWESTAGDMEPPPGKGPDAAGENKPPAPPPPPSAPPPEYAFLKTREDKIAFLEAFYKIRVKSAKTRLLRRMGEVEIEVAFRPKKDVKRPLPLLFVTVIHLEGESYVIRCHKITVPPADGSTEIVTFGGPPCHFVGPGGRYAKQLSVMAVLSIGNELDRFGQIMTKPIEPLKKPGLQDIAYRIYGAVDMAFH